MTAVMAQPLLLMAGFAALLCLCGLAALPALKRQERLAARVREIQRAARVDSMEPPRGLLKRRLLRGVTALGEAIACSGLLSTATLGDLQQTLHSAGFRGRGGLGLFVGAKLLLLLLLPASAWMLTVVLGLRLPHPKVILPALAVAGLLTPDQIVRSLRRSYLRAVDRGLPDALDMMVICSEAGLALETSIDRVAQEIRLAHPAVAEELTQCAQEMRVGADRRTALMNLANRTGLDNLRRLSVSLVQTLQYGTPLTEALRMLAAEMRQDLLTRFEARAARLPVLLTLPMIGFILPCVFLIVGGPAVLQILRLR